MGTFHSFSESRFSNGLANAIGARRVLNRLHVRIAVSEAAAWTGRRFFGGHYRVIPNGVHVDRPCSSAGAAAAPPPSDRLRIVFVGQSVERKGLPLLLRAFEALREHIPCELTVIGPTARSSRRCCSTTAVSGRSARSTTRASAPSSQRADVLCAPSLGGESFGMVLTEAFAAGTPVVASDIAGYRDVVRDGVDGVLVPRGDAQALAEALRDLCEEPERRAAMARAAGRDVERFAWPHVADEVMDAYRDAIATPAARGRAHRGPPSAVGVRAADLKPHVPARRLPSLEPPPPARGAPAWRRRPPRGARRGLARRASLLAVLALNKIGLDNIAARCSPPARRSSCSAWR